MFCFDIGFIRENSLVFVLFFCILLLCIVVLVCRHKIQKNEKEAAKQREISLEVASRRRISPKMKRYVLERDDYTCQICGISKGFLDELCPGLGDYLLLEADHICSVKRGGTGSDADNLQCLCWRCNRKKGGNKTNQEVKDEIQYGVRYFEE